MVLVVLTACVHQQENSDSAQNNGSEKEGQVLNTIKNVHFYFLDNGLAFDNKSDLVEECFEATQPTNIRA